MDELKMDIEEMSQLLEAAKRERVRELLNAQLAKLNDQLTAADAQKSEATSAVATAPPPTTTVKPAAAAVNKCYNVKLTNYAWDQSDRFVKLFVTLKNVHSLEAEKVYCKFTNKSVEVNVKELENRNYVLTVNNLLNGINESKSYWKVKTDMVVVFMAKSSENQNWSHLVSTDVKDKEMKMPDLDPDEDPYSGLMKLMKKMYDEGDDNMKRTIAKAWTENRNKDIEPTF